MKSLQLRREYLANLKVLDVKLHNLHWNVIGLNFAPIHEFTEKLYDALFAKFDDVAELLKMEGIYPPASLKEYLEISTIAELPSEKDFSEVEVLNIVRDDLAKMNDLAVAIREAADEEGNFLLVANMEDDIAEYKKNLWFLNSMLK